MTRCGDALNPKATVDPAETATTLKGDTDDVTAPYEDEPDPTVRRSPTLPNGLSSAANEVSPLQRRVRLACAE